ncbi:hypothetical protein GGQ86_003031 [Xanthobacter flavus]|uniref:Uncharacterized protein n=1 Tax=Xanthobacter flavus TaxID=281 RepID=A0A9W6FMY6_XANFL|nr:hypothetical protein [Xanthobacter flavus]MDR6334549.1 hypothetical protein [Xanthobacter flavus]GLI23433.1 hypothetical protein XFLAVUS301_31070 [Xanthobacter flavus]
MEFTFKGHEYRYLGQEPHTRRDGSETLLSVWETRCVECGRPFQLRTTLLGQGGPTRRCEQHRLPRQWSPRRKPATGKAKKGCREVPTKAPGRARTRSAAPTRPRHQICAAAARTLARSRRFGEWRTLQSLMWLASGDDWRALREPDGRSESLRRELGGRSEIPTPQGTLQVEERTKGHWHFRLPPLADWAEEMAGRYPWLG